MSDVLFPLTLPGLHIEVTRAPVFSTLVQGIGSRTLAHSWYDGTPKYYFKLKFNVLREGQTFTELAQVMSMLTDHEGAWDSFLLRDPYDNELRRVRFLDGQVATELVVFGIWKSKEIELIEVWDTEGVTDPTQGGTRTRRLTANAYVYTEPAVGEGDPMMLFAVRPMNLSGDVTPLLLRSYDGGDTWEQLDRNPFGWPIFFSHGARILAVTDDSTAKLAYSDDDGETWTSVSSPPKFWMLASNGTTVVGAGTSGLQYSTDGGETWNTTSVTAEHQFVVWDGTYFVAMVNTTGATYRSTDGQSWTAGGTIAHHEWENWWYDIATDGDGTIMLHDHVQVARSTDHGQTWSLIWEVDPEAWQMATNDIAYAADYGWVMGMDFYANNSVPGASQGDYDAGGKAISTNGGNTWTYSLISDPPAFTDWSDNLRVAGGRNGYAMVSRNTNYPTDTYVRLYTNGVARTLTVLAADWVPRTIFVR